MAEPATAAAQDLFAADPGVVAWWGSELECVSAVARLERESALAPAAVAQVLGRLDALAASWHEIQPTAGVRRTARRLLRVHRLRAADSLQLAAALAAAEGEPGSLELVTADERLADAAAREGFVVVSPTA